MKKLTLFVSILTALSLAACSNSSSKKEEKWEPYVPTPVEPISFKNYKIAVKFGESGDAIPEYASSYLTGSFNGWKSKFQKGDNAPYKLKLDTALGENVYSAVIPEAEPETILSFKVISIATENMVNPDSNNEYEVGWAYESAMDGNTNAEITPLDETPIVTTLTYVNMPADPEGSKFDVTINVTFTDYDAETHANYTYGAKGAWDNWANEASGAMSSSGVCTFVISNVLPGTYEWGINEYVSGSWKTWFGDGDGNASLTVVDEDLILNYTTVVSGGVLVEA
ncbi:MAG: hypothetical protein K6F07_03510 [Bacilli bacterium]|nr:hypothetical protein [Bacilli bacterium]